MGMSTTDWWTYLSDLMGEDTPTVAARKAGISASNFTRWKQGARADPDFVVKIARAYEASVLEALVAADFITEEEAGRDRNSSLADLRKVARYAKDASLNAASAAIRLEAALNEIQAGNDELTAKRSNTRDADVEPLPYAANRRTPEPEEGDDDFGPGA